jgi:hypothetical protein
MAGRASVEGFLTGLVRRVNDIVHRRVIGMLRSAGVATAAADIVGRRRHRGTESVHRVLNGSIVTVVAGQTSFIINLGITGIKQSSREHQSGDSQRKSDCSPRKMLFNHSGSFLKPYLVCHFIVIFTCFLSALPDLKTTKTVVFLQKIAQSNEWMWAGRDAGIPAAGNSPSHDEEADLLSSVLTLQEQ